MGDAGAVETELFQVGLAARGDEEMRALDDDTLAVFVEMHGDALHGRLDAFHPCVGIEHDLGILEPLEQHLGGLRILMGEEAGGVENGDVGAEHAMGLAELEADRAAAQDDQMLNALTDVEDGLIGQIRDLVEPRDRRDRRRGAGGDDEAAGADQHAAGLHGELVEEVGLRLDHADAEPGEAFDAIIRRYGGNGAMHMIVDAAMVDLRFEHLDAEGGGGAHRIGAFAGREQRLGGDAAIVEAIAPHEALLDEHDRHAELRRRRCYRKAT